MRNFIKDKVIKRILIIFVMIVMTTNFIMPNYVCAASAGEKMVSGLFYLIAYVGDVGIKVMQNMMVGTSEIKNGKNYEIKYSPGLIFSNSIAALDINFINPNPVTLHAGKKIVTQNKTILEEKHWTTKQGEIEDTNYIYYGTTTSTVSGGQIVSSSEGGGATQEKKEELLQQYGYYDASDASTGLPSTTTSYTWSNNGTKYQLTFATSSTGRGATMTLKLQVLDGGNIKAGKPEDIIKEWQKQYGYSKVSTKKIEEGERKLEETGVYSETYEWITGDEKTYQIKKITNYPVGSRDPNALGGIAAYLYEIQEEINYEDEREITSPAAELQTNISKWYQALRLFALVGLLSVLVYIGIRIIIGSTSAQEKAKYKGMLKDWIVAICILFVLHYVMSFLLEITGSLNNVINNNVVRASSADDLNTDELMNTIREKVGDSYNKASVGDTAGYTIMYLALVILTGIFTIQYLKRIVYMAFLTMIAPMIALTYPLDKIKDGKAQAFNYWLKEYIFNCIIQPVHFLIYTVLIENVIEFAKTNILYAIVALAFMVPAEKFIKEMFGMKSNSPSGTLGAAAGGALVMSMMNKLKSKGPKGDKGGQEPSGVRTATRTPSSDGAAVVPQNQVPMAQNASAGGTKMATTKTGTGSGTGSSQKTNSTQPQTGTNNNGSSTAQNKNKYSFARGLGEITGVNSLISAPGRTFKNAGKKLARAGGALGMAALGGTAMFANEIADGHLFDDPEKAVSNIAGAGVAGYMAGQSVEGRLGETIEKFERGALGDEAYNNKKFDKTFYASNGYREISQDSGVKSMCEQMGVSVHAATQQFLDNGITDASQIKMALQNGLNGDTFAEYNKQGITSPTDMVELMQNGIGAQSLKDIKTYGGETDAKKMMRYNTIAKAAKDDGVSQNETEFINWARTKHKMDDDEAKKLFKNVKFYWN